MLRLLTGIAISVAIVYLALCVALFFLQRSFIYFPQHVPSAPGENTVTVQVPDAELKVTTRPLAGTRALLYFGGNAEDVSANLLLLANAFPDRALYLPYYRGYGGSSGKPSEEALYSDALALFDQIRVTHPDVVVIGRSLGSGIAVRLASVRPVTRLVLVTPFDSLQELAAQQFPFFPVRWLLLDKFESWRYAPQVSAPTVLVVAEHDEIMPRENAERLLSHFSEGVAAFRLIPGVGHNSISASPAYVPALKEMP
jgi:pimeloyl-ACP methyl ester carboxylesterase